MLTPDGEVPADIVEALQSGVWETPYHGDVAEHLWLDQGQDGSWCWRLTDYPVYVVRLADGTLEKGPATY